MLLDHIFPHYANTLTRPSGMMPLYLVNSTNMKFLVTYYLSVCIRVNTHLKNFALKLHDSTFSTQGKIQSFTTIQNMCIQLFTVIM
jgi:hypothetical protein